jgi:hypothetical protein
MKIFYVAKHGAGGNCDEASITSSLQELGHDVICITEYEATQYPTRITGKKEGILLFHKWIDIEVISQTKIPKVFWYFDLVDFKKDYQLQRSNQRKRWIELATELVDLGFCTDGDWVLQDTTDKLVRLNQGADGKLTGRHKPDGNHRPIMFAGSIEWDRERRRFIEDMYRMYGKQTFHHVTSSYRQELGNIIANSAIVVAPPSPVSDNYWSNRLYIMSGFGGFVLHPYCKTIAEHYLPDSQIVMYTTQKDLHTKIDYYLKHPEERKRVSELALRRTVQEHTYKHRCATLIKTVQERLDVK